MLLLIFMCCLFSFDIWLTRKTARTWVQRTSFRCPSAGKQHLHISHTWRFHSVKLAIEFHLFWFDGNSVFFLSGFGECDAISIELSFFCYTNELVALNYNILVAFRDREWEREKETGKKGRRNSMCHWILHNVNRVSYASWGRKKFSREKQKRKWNKQTKNYDKDITTARYILTTRKWIGEANRMPKCMCCYIKHTCV